VVAERSLTRGRGSGSDVVAYPGGGRAELPSLSLDFRKSRARGVRTTDSGSPRPKMIQVSLIRPLRLCRGGRGCSSRNRPWSSAYPGLIWIGSGLGGAARGTGHARSRGGVCEAGRIASLDGLSSPAFGPCVPRVTAVTQSKSGHSCRPRSATTSFMKLTEETTVQKRRSLECSKCLTINLKITCWATYVRIDEPY
jgi:hypothetical protein